MIRRALSAVRRLRKRLYRVRYGTLTSVNTDTPAVALTFDDGPHPDSTPAILELLDRYHAKATFFLVGRRAERYPDLVRRIIDAGHEVANHTYDHLSLPMHTPGEAEEQLSRARDAIGSECRWWFRPPFGHQTQATQRLARRMGYRVVAWSVIAEDWRSDSAEMMAERVMRGIMPGAIILMHEFLYCCFQDRMLADRGASLAALEMILRAAQGYRFLTVAGLLSLGRPNYTNWLFPPQPRNV